MDLPPVRRMGGGYEKEEVLLRRSSGWFFANEKLKGVFDEFWNNKN